MSLESDQKIREATEADIPALIDLFRQEVAYAQQLAGYYELDPDFDWTAYVRDKLGRRNQKVFVAESEGQLLGFIYARITGYTPPQPPKSLLKRLLRRSRPRPGLPLKPFSFGVLDQVFVTPPHRRQRLAIALASEAMRWLEKRDIQRIEIGIYTDNLASQALYGELGFETYRVLMQKSN